MCYICPNRKLFCGVSLTTIYTLSHTPDFYIFRFNQPPAVGDSAGIDIISTGRICGGQYCVFFLAKSPSIIFYINQGCFLQKNSGCYPLQTLLSDHSSLRFLFLSYDPAGCLRCIWSTSHVPGRFPDLQINAHFTFSHLNGSCNGYRSSLPAYSDQFAQDSHLIPSSEFLKRTLHLILQYSITHH